MNVSVGLRNTLPDYMIVVRYASIDELEEFK